MTEEELLASENRNTHARELLKDLNSFKRGLEQLPTQRHIQFIFDDSTFCAINTGTDSNKIHRVCWDQQIPDLKVRIQAALTAILNVEIARISKELSDL